ncbi:MAG: propanediol utilization protein [Candidatus Komeilibacteria bacterium CG11_big_fil_rev_8_21_14_0_20_36_20]|uniref:Phosphate propanoyltransferase n=1 Tax=Candidatus Komeilibacteria bacterium CG11_big_fil_rev_8_21_14_0_20_36_20 TaxID=1974477 RepID=A0A2H0NE10_9BACT|nr:MAG: propanediol utilization protein [Candidatus Komeilibacteria bacterium CG11_big_fil_rev_8_21_14_0_20_36_20]PIR81448.1 MAG: propanediol utilization protein [Candidatus Komeilibacteria bacterium CG10_big_fil_rev_8_21_14_0_10_36_65]PJC55649.1 MAG: propanediol utilization protein [Candidatus Komeilibacteria bacterium CG_4_9_14_0_2_um_filter_36_13]
MKKAIAEISARHLHISPQHLAKLFGPNFKLKKQHKLSQPGEFASKQTLEIIGLKNKLEKVRIVGPVRKKTQIELSLTDCIFLGIRPVLRLSGDVKNSPGVILKGPKGKLKIREGVIIPKRHLHLPEKQAKSWGLKNKQKIKVSFKGPRAAILKEVMVRVGDYKTRVHLDTDEANAIGIKNNATVELSF